MKAGQTNLNVGKRVELQNIKGEDKILNGLTGTITHPFAFGNTGKNWVGIWLDENNNSIPYGSKCNVRITEIKIL